jgi:hypothetical protein
MSHLRWYCGLRPDEVQKIENTGKGLRKLTEVQYDRFLADYESGDYDETELDEDEKRLRVRNRLKAAATRRNLGIEFRRTGGSIIRLKVVSANGQGDVPTTASAPELVVEPQPPTAPTKRKGGRPKKTSA